MRELTISSLVIILLLSACGKVPSAVPDAASFTPSSVDTIEPEVDVATTLVCSRSVAGTLFEYTVVRHTVTPEVSVECRQGANTFSATYAQGHARFNEAVCQIILNAGTNEYWVFATPNAGSGQPTQANYANNGFGGAQVNFANSDCEEE